MQVGNSTDLALSLLKNNSVRQIVKHLRRVVEVPFNASVRDTLNTMQAHDILAVAVAAPPGQWIGAGGSQILEADKITGALRKHYIGLVSVLDILVHIVKEEAPLNAPISNVIGSCFESLNLWTIGPGTSIYDVLEPMSRGVHRVLVPFESDHDVVGVEFMDTSSGYHMLTQTDVVRFLQDHSKELEDLLGLSVVEVGAVKRSVFAVPHTMSVMIAFEYMAKSLLPAVAIVKADPVIDTQSILINGEGRKLMGTLSASDLRCCMDDALCTSSFISVLDWTRKAWITQQFGAGAAVGQEINACNVKPPVTCQLGTPLGDVIALALDNRVHRVWIVDNQGLLMGLVALSDILSVFHKLSDEF